VIGRRRNPARLCRADEYEILRCAAYGLDETADEATERHFESRPEDRGCPRIIPVNTGVPRSESYG
jgi:hypothetical protein